MTSRQRSKHFYRYIMVGLLKIRIKKTLKDDQKKKKLLKKKKKTTYWKLISQKKQ